MRFFLKVFLIFLFATAFLKAQDTTDEEGLYPENFEFESDLIGHYSHGWFPTPGSGKAVMFSGMGSDGWTSFLIDNSTSIRSKSFKNTKFPFAADDPFKNDKEREFAKTGKDKTDDFPEQVIDKYDGIFLWNLPFPAIFRASAGLEINTNILYSNDESREYLDLAGHRRVLKEVNVLAMDEYLLKASAGFNIPIYGAFLSATEFGGLSSYYYLYGGVTGYYALSSSATQYSQIANAKEQLRYGNGRDTVQFMNDTRLGELNSFRYSYDVSIGWNASAGPAIGGAEISAIIPQTSFLKDADWRQYLVGLRLMIGYTWQ